MRPFPKASVGGWNLFRRPLKKSMKRILAVLAALLLASLPASPAAGADPDATQRPAPRGHWSLQPLAVSGGKHSIDEFIDAKLAEKNLHRSPPAAPVALIRRLAFDLIGLPPTPEQVAAFVAECRFG